MDGKLSVANTFEEHVKQGKCMGSLHQPSGFTSNCDYVFLSQNIMTLAGSLYAYSGFLMGNKKADHLPIVLEVFVPPVFKEAVWRRRVAQYDRQAVRLSKTSQDLELLRRKRCSVISLCELPSCPYRMCSDDA